MTEGGSSLATYYNNEEHRKEQSLRKKDYYKNNPNKKKANDDMLKELSLKTAKQRSEKMKNHYLNKEGLYEINEKRKKKVLCIETGIVFDSLTAASKAYNISIGNLSMVIHGKRQVAGGYHWKLIEG